MSGNALYICASVCIKERIGPSWDGTPQALRTEAMQSDAATIGKLRAFANFVPIAEAPFPQPAEVSRELTSISNRIPGLLWPKRAFLSRLVESKISKCFPDGSDKIPRFRN